MGVGISINSDSYCPIGFVLYGGEPFARKRYTDAVFVLMHTECVFVPAHAMNKYSYELSWSFALCVFVCGFLRLAVVRCARDAAYYLCAFGAVMSRR